jgi:protoporphyrinogen oxidase
MPKGLILGGGVTGLAAARRSGFPVYEARPEPGGICSSYYLQGYRFERGGGHWLFGGDPQILDLIRQLVPVQSYKRHSAVFFCKKNLFVPFPLQYHLSFLGHQTASQAVAEMSASEQKTPVTMRDWLYDRFGSTLCELFFAPFHERYTAGLWEKISPQDDYKTPIRMEAVRQGALGAATADAGYNVQFLYPQDGLDALVARLAPSSLVHLGCEVTFIGVAERTVHLADGRTLPYDDLLCTLPLCKMGPLTGLKLGQPDPYTSVMVLNLGALKGKLCPSYHWLYLPNSESGFHRVGFYSNVEPSFLPAQARSDRKERISLYIERAYPGGEKPSPEETASFVRSTIAELQRWQFIEEVEVADPTWIDVAYTWSIPESHWKETALAALESHGIHPVGRYGRWVFQGIADSIRDGLALGATFGQR